jgi:hypothetical protein
MWKLEVRVTIHSEKVLCSNDLISIITQWKINCIPLILSHEKERKWTQKIKNNLLFTAFTAITDLVTRTAYFGTGPGLPAS